MIPCASLASGSFPLHPHVQLSLHEWVDGVRRYIAPPTTKGLHGIDKNNFDVSSKSDLLAELASGTLLCELVNVLYPGAIQRVHGNNPSVYGQLDNLGQLLSAFKSMGIECCYQPRDVVTGRSLLEFVASILAFAKHAYDRSPTMPNPPPVLSTDDLQRMHSTNASNTSLPGLKPLQGGALGLSSGPDLSVLNARMSSLEEQQHRLMDMMAGVERMTAMTQRSMDQLVSGLLDAFADIQLLRGMNAGSMHPVPSTGPGLAQAAEAFPSASALGYVSAASVNSNHSYQPDGHHASGVPGEHGTAIRHSQRFPAGFDFQTTLPPAPALPTDVMPPPSSSRAHAHTISQAPMTSFVLQTARTSAVPATFPRYATSTLRSMDTIQYLPDDDNLPPVTSLDNLDGCRSGAQSVLEGRIPSATLEAFDADADDERTMHHSVRGSQQVDGESVRRERHREATSDDSISMHTVATTVRSAERKSISELLALKGELSARLPTAVLDACNTRIDLLRQSAIYELIETERDFVRDMSVVVEVVKPWVSQRTLEASNRRPESCSPMLKSPEVLFGNMEQVLENHMKIMDLMNEQVDKSPVIEGIELVVQDMIPLLDVHVSYATHYSREIIPVLKLSEMGPICQEVAQLPETNRQSLDSLLIKPIQRVSKYPLLLGEIRKHSFENAPNYKLLESALSSAQQLLEKVNANSATPSQATSAQLAVFAKTVSGFHGLDLSPECEFVREGAAWRWSLGKLTPVHWILFGELLLVCKPSSARSLRKKYDILSSLVPTKLVVVPTGTISAHPNVFPMDLLPVGDEHEGVSESASLAAWVVSGATSASVDKLPVMTFAFDSTDERGAWIRALEKAVSVEVAKGRGSGPSAGGLTRKRSKKTSWMGGGKKAMSPGPNFSLHAGLPKSPMTPHDMPDNCEILVRTVDAHTPATRFELGFAKWTYLRVVNQDHDYWKVSMNRMCGLVPKALVTKVETDSSRYSHLIQACQSDMALTWIDCPGDCTVSMRRTAIVGNEGPLLDSAIKKRHGRSASMSSVASRVSELIGEVVNSRVGSKGSKASEPDQETSDKSPPPRPTSASSERSAHRGGHRRTSSIASKQAKLNKRQGSKASSTDGLIGGGLFSSGDPAAAKHMVVPVEGRNGWRQVIPTNGDKPYFFNVETGQSVWVLAAGDSGTMVTSSGNSRAETPVRSG